jgi:hypothetical protein
MLFGSIHVNNLEKLTIGMLIHGQVIMVQIERCEVVSPRYIAYPPGLVLLINKTC